MAAGGQHAPNFKSRMSLKVLVLDGKNCIVQDLWIILILRDYPTLQSERPECTALIVIKNSIGNRAIVTEILYLWKINGIYESQSCQCSNGG